MSVSLVALIGLLFSPPASASLTFSEALNGGDSTPEVEGARNAKQTQDDFDDVSWISERPTLTVGPGWRTASDDPGLEAFASLMLGIDVNGLGAARNRALKSERAELSSKIDVVVLAKRLEVARLWLDAWHASRRLEAAGHDEDLARTFEKSVERALALEAVTRDELEAARAYTAEATLARLAAEGDLNDRSVALATALALELTHAHTSGDPPRPPLPDPAQWEQVIANTAQLPSARLASLKARAAKMRLIEQRADQRSKFVVGAQLQREASGDLLVFGTIGVTLPFGGHASRTEAPLAAEAELESGDSTLAIRRARAELDLAKHEVDHSREVEAHVRDILLPATTAALSAAERRFRVGQATIGETLAARRHAASAARSVTDAQADRAWAEIRAWLLVAAVRSSK